MILTRAEWFALPIAHLICGADSHAGRKEPIMQQHLSDAPRPPVQEPPQPQPIPPQPELPDDDDDDDDDEEDGQGHAQRKQLG